MKKTIIAFCLLLVFSQCKNEEKNHIFDVHLHGDAAPEKQLKNLAVNGVHSVAVSTSWNEQQQYKTTEKIKVWHGIFLPCPAGKVPYSLQQCFQDGKVWPEIKWVEEQIQNDKINFIGEVLTQYQGISSSDTLMYPYYALAEKYDIPVGVHTGSAGPDHGCPDFKEEMGNPSLLKNVLNRFPKLKVWLMHAGGPFEKEAIELMKTNRRVYADISVLNNPAIIPPAVFSASMKKFIDAGLEDQLMFGTDNADIKTCIKAVEGLSFLTVKQKNKIYNNNALVFFNP